MITLKNGETIVDELAVADAHPLGARPFGRAQYIDKFRILAEGVVSPAEQDRFLTAAENAPKLAAGELGQLNVTVADEILAATPTSPKGLF